MSRISGRYTWLSAGNGARGYDLAVRWLDPSNGCTYLTETSSGCMGAGYKLDSYCRDWCNGDFLFTPDAPRADWYVLRFIPEGVFCGEKRNASTITTGPYTEANARIQAVNWTEQTKSKTCKVAVVQLLAGNTLTREQPPAPAPVLVWS